MSQKLLLASLFLCYFKWFSFLSPSLQRLGIFLFSSQIKPMWLSQASFLFYSWDLTLQNTTDIQVGISDSFHFPFNRCSCMKAVQCQNKWKVPVSFHTMLKQWDSSPFLPSFWKVSSCGYSLFYVRIHASFPFLFTNYSILQYLEEMLQSPMFVKIKYFTDITESQLQNWKSLARRKERL